MLSGCGGKLVAGGTFVAGGATNVAAYDGGAGWGALGGGLPGTVRALACSPEEAPGGQKVRADTGTAGPGLQEEEGLLGPEAADGVRLVGLERVARDGAAWQRCL